jgi:ABC-type bacteriocin/lantibiotic exporter with double-glycine peptidase domain
MAKDNTSITSLLKYAWRYIRYQKIPFLLSPFVLIFSVARPLVIKQFIDNIVANKPMRILLTYALILIGLALAEAIMNTLINYAYARVANIATIDEQKKLFAKITRLPVYVVEEKSGDLLSRLLYDTPHLTKVMSIAWSVLILNILAIIIVIGVLLYLSWQLTLISILIIPVIALIQIVFASPLMKATKLEREKYAEMTSNIKEKLDAIYVIKGLNKEHFFTEKLSDIAHSWLHVSNKMALFATLEDEGMMLILSLTPVIVIGAGGLLIAKGTITLGTLVAFYSYLNWLYSPVKMLGGFIVSLQKSTEILKRVEEVYNLPEEKDGSYPLTKINYVNYKDVMFAYKEKPVLQNINFKIQYGEIISIVGGSGSGKSTLFKLLPRFIDPQKGDIFINENSIKEYLLHSLRQRVILVRSTDPLFNMSIRDNILLGDNFSEEEFIKATQMACVDKFIKELPQGYDTLAGEKGSNLSDGQRQRVAIARAIIRKPDILILDEATSGVDAETEEKIFTNLMALGITVIIVSHRLSTIRKAGRIVVIDNGKAVAEGTHEELINSCDIYRNLIQNQIMKD